MQTHTAQGQGVFTMGVGCLKVRDQKCPYTHLWRHRVYPPSHEEPSLSSPHRHGPNEHGKASRALGEERGHAITPSPLPMSAPQPLRFAQRQISQLLAGWAMCVWALQSPLPACLRPLAPAAGAFLHASIPPAASRPPPAPPCMVPPPHSRRPGPCVGFDSAPGAWLRQTTPHWTPFKLLQALKLGLEPERKY